MFSADGVFPGYIGATSDYDAIPVWPAGTIPLLPPPGAVDTNVPCEWRITIHPPAAVPNEIQLVTTWAQIIEVRTLDGEDVVIDWRGPGDINGDGDVGTDRDISDFFACLGGNCCAHCAADFNGDGNLGTDADIESMYAAIAGQTP